MSKIIINLIAFLLLAFSFTACKPSKAVYFVPIGQLESIATDELQSYYTQKFGTPVKVLPLIPFEKDTYDYGREQFVAEELIKQIKHAYPAQSAEPESVLVGITDADMYIRKMDWQFGFSYRQDEHFAVVACARMNPVAYEKTPNPALLKSRIKKMISKNIGTLYYHKELNANPRSVLYNNVMGLEELDTMGEDF